MCHFQFFDEKIVAKDVDIFVIDNPSNHFVGSEDEDVGVGGVNGVDFALLLESDARDLCFSAALNKGDSEDLTQTFRLIKVLWFEIDGAQFFLFEFDLFFQFGKLFVRDPRVKEQFSVLDLLKKAWTPWDIVGIVGFAFAFGFDFGVGFGFSVGFSVGFGVRCLFELTRRARKAGRTRRVGRIFQETCFDPFDFLLSLCFFCASFVDGV